MYNICSSSDKSEAIKTYCNKQWKETSSSVGEKTDQLFGKYLYSQKTSLTFAYQNRGLIEIFKISKKYGIST